MQNSKLKNSIVLRGMASNVVDEAIVILKPNIKVRKTELSKNTKIQEPNFSKDFIVKEAENVITEYINKINEKNVNEKISKMQKKIKILRIVNVAFFVLLLITIFLRISGFN